MWIPNRKQWKSKGSKHAPKFVALWRGKGAWWSSGMGLRRIDKFHLLTQAYTKWLMHSWNIFGVRTSHEQLGLTKLTTARTWGKPPPSPYNILCACPRGPHPNDFLSQDSQVEVPKLSKLKLLRLWSPITLHVDLKLRWDLKKSCSPHRKLSNDVSHATCMQRNQVDSRLLMVESQTTNLTPSLSFGHNLCFRCLNQWCEPILNI